MKSRMERQMKTLYFNLDKICGIIYYPTNKKQKGNK
jgi:hypothetical protein